MVKKAWLLSILLVIVFITFLLKGFSSHEKGSLGEEKITFVTPLAPVAYFAQRIGGEYVEAMALLPTDQDYHNFELSPSQVSKSYQSDVFLTLGTAEEKPILEKMTDSNLLIYNISSQLEFIPYGEFHEEHSHHDHHHHGEKDPHVWLGFSNMKNISLTITNILKEVIPEQSEYFQDNLDILLSQINILEKEVEETFSPYSHYHLVVMHAGYGYLLAPFHIDQLSLESFQGESSLKQLVEVSSEKNEEGIFPFILIQPQYNPEQAKSISNTLGLDLVLFNPIYQDPFKEISSLLVQVKELGI